MPPSPGVVLSTLPAEAAHAIERLRALSRDYGTLIEILDSAHPVAGTPALPELASWYGTAQGLSTAALALLLAASEQPYAHTTLSGHQAVEALGQLVKHSADITTRIAGTVRIAAEYHRIDGIPDPVTGRMSARPAVHRQDLDQWISRTLAMIPAARAACANAIAFTEAAGLREAARAGEPAPLPELNWAEHQALRLITDDQVLLSADRRNHRRVWTGSGERISPGTLDSLTEKQLIRLDASGSLAAGQRLRPTEQGRQALDTARRRPVATSLTSPQHRALHLVHTSTVTYWQWPGKQPTVTAGTAENITLRSVNSLLRETPHRAGPQHRRTRGTALVPHRRRTPPPSPSRTRTRTGTPRPLSSSRPRPNSLT
ncbi:hypothetical protein ACLF6K_35785 [Streptomyces xanthophaeus]|uniref:hypothetical protein n=1 Tax=Streptomyces xanthophaeus TaxID=67385 RepID=UPI00399018CC